MGLDTNFNVFPYWDDYDPDKEFYGILYKPKTSVQARELNQMQTILRNQIEKFGDQIFQVGTIIDGCNFQFYPNFCYVKIKDLDVNGLNVTPASYVGLFTKNAANLQAIVVDSAVGFESTPPDLNTLYLSYRNSGNTGNLTAYSLGDTLQIFDSNSGIWAVTVNNAGIGFANSDTPIFIPRLAVNVTSGSFSNGDYVTQPSTGANLQIIGIDATSLAPMGQIVLTLNPRATDLANAQANGSQWATANNDSIKNASNTAAGQVMAVFGSGAQAALTTDGSGRIIQISMLNRGFGYTYLPTATVESPNNASGIASVSLIAQNYVTNVVVSNTAGSVGNGYAFGVSEGTIFQKGLFLKVDAQTIIVDKYDTSPNNVSVGFTSLEQIITSDIDTSLLDNAQGFPNYQAPGADRIKVTPQLSLAQTDSINTNDFFPIVSWSEGNPYQQNQTSAYSAIGDKMAQELYETEGDFIISRFDVTSRSPITANLEGTKVSLITNPGSAYVQGYRVFNATNYSVDILKSTDTTISNNLSMALNYGNWLRVKEVGGVFQFSTGDTVTFYDTAKSFISGGYVNTGNTTPQGNQLGTARVRSMVAELGIPGAANTTYRLYLFDINLNQGVNFSSIRSVAYTTGTSPGIADVVLTLDASTNKNIARLANTLNDDLLFDSGAVTLKNANNITYTYRTIDQTLAFANTGLLTKTIVANPGETFPYVGTLGAGQMLDLYVVPTGNSIIASANVTGTANVLNSSNTILGNGSTFINDLAQGDYVYLFQNSTVFSVQQVVSIANNTSLQLAANPSFTGNNIAVYRYFPQYAAIPFGLRSGLSANVSANQQVLTLNLGLATQGAVTVNTAVAVNITRANVAPVTKSASRDQFVKLSLSNNAGGTTGPWCLGVSDIFRMKRIFVDTSSSVSNTSTEVTTFFYIDHKQNEDYLDIGFLYLKPNAGLNLTSSEWLLVQFDAFQTTGSGFAITPSYTTANAATIAVNDSTPLINMGSAVSSWEIPECFGSRGQYWDMASEFDFRPIAANSATPTTNSATAPVNPTYSLSFGNTANPANDKKFPLPDSIMTYNMEQYCFRTDSVFADQSGKIVVVRGTPAVSSPKTPHDISNSLRLVDVYLPPYPCLPATCSLMQLEILALGIANMNYTAKRQANKTIAIPSLPGTPYDTQPRRYTMADIGTLDRRIGALEYYNTLSALQTDMVNRVVPSSSNAAINRFKFGVFVDSFDTTISQDITNPSYAAAISGSNMTPPMVDWVISYGDAPAIQLSYMDFKLIGQDDATFGSPTPPPQPNTPTPTPITTNTTIWLLRTDHLAPNPSGSVVLTDYASVSASTKGGTATLYFYVNPTATIFGGLVDPDNFKIYQGSTLIADAYDNAVSLTGSDIAFLNSGQVPASWFNGVPLGTALGRPSAGFVYGAGKVSFSIPASASGLTYTIVSTRQSPYDHWIYALQYPSLFGETIVVPPTGTVSNYSGHMDVEPPSLLLAMTTPTTTAPQLSTLSPQQGVFNSSSNFTNLGANLGGYVTLALSGDPLNGTARQTSVNPSASLLPQSFGITVYGLKPSTAHNFYVNSVLKTAETINLYAGTPKGAPLMTDANGILRFNWYYNGAGADQNIQNSFVSPQTVQNLAGGSTVGWAAEQAASMTQPLGVGTLSLQVSTPATAISSAFFTLTVLADADFILSTSGISAAVSQNQLIVRQTSAPPAAPAPVQSVLGGW